MKTNKILNTGLALLFSAGFTFTSCVDTGSNLVDFDPSLETPNDTVYSLLGIINKMQVIADRTIVLGEVKGDLASVTDAALLDIANLANYTAGTDNQYNKPEDYYAVIQNCNYYISKADTNLAFRGEKVFIREYAAVKAYRAWTYLQLAIHYGKVPFFTKPLLTELEADPSLYPKYDVKQICDYFIKDLAPYVETDLPDLGGTFSSYFIPVRALLGDLCLWAGRYLEAATYYHDYLTHVDNPIPVGLNYMRWNNSDFQGASGTYSATSSVLCYIPMEASEYDGIISELDDVFTSTEDNQDYYQVTSSSGYAELSAAQRYVLVYTNPSTQLQDTISPADDFVYSDEMMRGDLRYSSVFTFGKSAGTDGFSERTQSIQGKFPTNGVLLYRPAALYLRMAEAYNRAGFPQSAFAILKYGLFNTAISRYISEDERQRAGSLLTWSQYNFTVDNTQGIHSNGSGNADADTTYVIPDDLTSLEDSILFVEDKICDEMALELVFEGSRFGDLQRIALHRDDPQFLARKVAARGGKNNFNNELFERLKDKNNWYLPLE